MYDDLLPIGSVVLLTGGEVKLMITGRLVTDEAMKDIYDYVGVFYPMGMAADTDQYFFNRDAVQTVYHVGYIDDDELEFHDEVLSQIDELEIRDGRIVPKGYEE